MQDLEPTILQQLSTYFGSNPFLKIQVQGFEKCGVGNVYRKEEESFLKTVKIVTRDDVHKNANVVNSHVIYKTKRQDEGT